MNLQKINRIIYISAESEIIIDKTLSDKEEFKFSIQANSKTLKIFLINKIDSSDYNGYDTEITPYQLTRLCYVASNSVSRVIDKYLNINKEELNLSLENNDSTLIINLNNK